MISTYWARLQSRSAVGNPVWKTKEAKSFCKHSMNVTYHIPLVTLWRLPVVLKCLFTKLDSTLDLTDLFESLFELWMPDLHKIFNIWHVPAWNHIQIQSLKRPYLEQTRINLLCVVDVGCRLLPMKFTKEKIKTSTLHVPLATMSPGPFPVFQYSAEWEWARESGYHAKSNSYIILHVHLPNVFDPTVQCLRLFLWFRDVVHCLKRTVIKVHVYTKSVLTNQ